MKRSLAVVAALFVGLGSVAASQADEPCHVVSDPDGDATTEVLVARDLVPLDPYSARAVDITSVEARTTADTLEVSVRVVDLSTVNVGPGGRYFLWFSSWIIPTDDGGELVRIGANGYSGAMRFWGTRGQEDTPFDVTGRLDIDSSSVVIDVPRERAGASTEGQELYEFFARAHAFVEVSTELFGDKFTVFPLNHTAGDETDVGSYRVSVGSCS